MSTAMALAALARRGMHTTPRLASQASIAPTMALPARRPVGAFRGGLFGFLVGSALAGAGVYGYVVQEYKASNDLLTEDIYNLHAAVQRATNHVHTLEDRLSALERRGARGQN